jgi:hypothetical protein
MNPETNDASTIDTDNNILYTNNLFPIEYNNNSYYHNHSNSIFDYINHYIADNLGEIIYDDAEHIIAPIVALDGQEYAEDQDAFTTAAPTATAAEVETEETDYSQLVCCICDNLLVDRYVTCCDSCQREYNKIKSLDNYKY